MSERWLTIGVEEEFQIVDSEGQLRSHIDTLMEAATPALGEQVKAEMLQSVVEVGTTICENVDELRGELVRLRGTLASLLLPAGLRIVSAGTHPFSHWQEQQITEKERYKVLEEELQDVVRELLIFGLHVHVGIPDRERRVEVMNEARYFLPHLLALSTSSPFWLTRVTGLKSYRSTIWSRFPRTGIPPEFSSYDEFENFVDLLVRTGCIPDGSKIWWDMRPHHLYPTLEFRVCDAATRVDETVCLAALVQAICAKLLRLRSRNLGFRKYLPNVIQENKWRAMRHGIDGKLIDFGKQEEVPMRELALELLDFVDDVVDELGSRKAVSYVHTILRDGTSADRQLRVFKETGHLHKVVDHLAEETLAGIAVRV
ncbi:MAG: carboxylate-amine ligase [Chloroflexi bacterium 13_1_40CM_4_68_4]|nr:MAG: carboxylate-amine ligase [Chloroflexi bacterium 13_1_40CM_4_68_4]